MNDLVPLEHSSPCVMRMRWQQLAFLHWPVKAALLEPLIPAGLQLQRFEGQAWLGVVPFEMAGVRANFVPEIPGTNRFLELNVRTYVTDGLRPGVWFFSLDCANPLAVRAARLGFHLPYFDAQMHMEPNPKQGHVHYRSRRTHRDAPEAVFEARYGPLGSVYHSIPGSLEHWLTERYCLYSCDAHGQVYRGEIVHPRWPLQACQVEVIGNEMTRLLGFDLPKTEPLAHFAQTLSVQAWWPQRLQARR